MIFLKKYWQIILVIVFCFWAVKTLANPGFFPAHDNAQIARLFEIDKVVKDGQIPPRWVPDLGFGFGYPIFNFYSPFVYYLGEGFHLLGFSLINSMKLVIILGFSLSSLFMYLWSRNHFGKIPSIFAAFLYTYAPYHAVDVYVRGDLSEFFSFVIIPAIFWSLDLLAKKRTLNSIFILGFLLGLLVLTHNLTVVMFIPFFAFYVVYLFTIEGKKIPVPIFFSVLIGFGLSAYYSLPAIFEKQYTLIDKVNIGELFNYKLHFVCIKELINSPWGYGGSLPNCFSGLSFEIGKIGLLSVFLALLIFIYLFSKKKIKQYKLELFIFLMFLFSLYMTNSRSEWIWERIGVISYLQFPWRFLLFSAVFSSFLGGFVVSWLEKNKGGKIAFLSAIILGVIALILVSSDFEPQLYLKPDYFSYQNNNKLQWDISKESFEYLPKGVATKLSDIKTTQIDITKLEIPSKPYKILTQNLTANIIYDKSQFKLLKVSSKGKSIIRFNTFSFPGWKTFLDGKGVDYSDNNKLKLITLDIPSGSHTLDLEFTNTIPRAVGNAITIVTILNLLSFGFFRVWIKLKS